MAEDSGPQCAYSKTIVCLANSRKTSGRCVAGKEVDDQLRSGEWVRPVSSRPTQEVSEEERRYENGAGPQLLDIIRIPLRAAQPHAHQSENHLIDERFYWVKQGRMAWQQLQAAVDTSAQSLWGTGHSSYYGLNDRLPKNDAEKLKTSLMLIKPEEFTVRVVVEGREFGNPRRRVRADFKWKSQHYVLPVTDPVAEREYLAKKDGDYELKDVLLCVSLGEAHTDDNCYKFVAALITPDRARTA